MPAFLSSEWLDALDDAARAIGPVAGMPLDGRVVLEQDVRGGPNGDVRYQFVVEAAGIRVGREETADLAFVSDYATAVALARGTTNTQQALAVGAVRLRGDVEGFAAARDALVALGDVFAAVRADTTF